MDGSAVHVGAAQLIGLSRRAEQRGRSIDLALGGVQAWFTHRCWSRSTVGTLRGS